MIEYQGEVVRATVADCRERRLYDRLVGAGTYVFTLNGDRRLAVDATRQGQLPVQGVWCMQLHACACGLCTAPFLTEAEMECASCTIPLTAGVWG